MPTIPVVVSPAPAIEGIKSLYIIKPSPGKGLGVFATSAIRKGTRVMSEPPVMSIRHDQALQHLISQFNALSTEKRQLYMQLFVHVRPDDGLVNFLRKTATDGSVDEAESIKRMKAAMIMSIFRSNAYENPVVGTASVEEIAGIIGLDTSRINHSCIANANYSYNEATGKINVYACRDLAAGEEITITYVTWNLTLKDRQEKFHDTYGFRCSCPACDGSPFCHESQVRRAKMLALQDNLDRYSQDPSSISAKEALENGQKAIRLFREEGIVDGALMASLNSVVAVLARQRPDGDVTFLGHFRNALMHSAVCYGVDHPTVQSLVSEFQDFCKESSRSTAWQVVERELRKLFLSST